MKTRIFTILIFLGAFFDTIYSVIADNFGILTELGISNKTIVIVKALGLFWVAFSRSLTQKIEVQSAMQEDIGLPKPRK
jgi:hypothetical protein